MPIGRLRAAARRRSHRPLEPSSYLAHIIVPVELVGDLSVDNLFQHIFNRHNPLDFREFVNSGGMIEFGLKDDRINVQMNIDAVEAARLRVEDRLLKLATVVHPAPSEGAP